MTRIEGCETTSPMANKQRKGVTKMCNAVIAEARKDHEETAVALDGIADALEAFGSYEVASEFRAHAAMNRAVAEYYDAFPYSQGAYSGKESKNGDSAYQLYSSHFLSWLAEKAREEERKERKKRIEDQLSEQKNADGVAEEENNGPTDDEPYEEPDE